MTVAEEMSEYRPEWPGEFARLAASIRAALGPLALRIDHIGSTSVPGLNAKDRIDIQVTVADFEPQTVAALAAGLEGIGYSLRPDIASDHRPPHLSAEESPDPEWEKRYFRAPEGQRPTNLHVRAAGRANQRYALLFRDYLRTHPAAAAGYGELKRRLAVVAGEDRDAYVDTKDPVCDILLAAAEDWAAATGWAPGPSDA
jgi:GrpB-like predicted nucleotidyltransferase (UPF0157 family)